MDPLIDIRALRQRIGLTQNQLAEAVQVTPNTVARWERGELTMSAPVGHEGVEYTSEREHEATLRETTQAVEGRG